MTLPYGFNGSTHCPTCLHPWAQHVSVGCIAAVDSAWTPDNARSCGCSNTKDEHAARVVRLARLQAEDES
jgi:hypothetical protein